MDNTIKQILDCVEVVYEFRCTVASKYGPGTDGCWNASSRQGHYIVDVDEEGARAQMAERFPGHAFDVEHWKLRLDILSWEALNDADVETLRFAVDDTQGQYVFSVSVPEGLPARAFPISFMKHAFHDNAASYRVATGLFEYRGHRRSAGDRVEHRFAVSLLGAQHQPGEVTAERLKLIAKIATRLAIDKREMKVREAMSRSRVEARRRSMEARENAWKEEERP